MRWKWIIGSVVILIMALMVAVYAVLSTYDYSKLKPQLAQLVKDATGRELSLGGEVDLAIGFSPALVVTEVTLANASWGSRPQMIKVDKLEVQLRLLPLLFREIQLKRIGLAGVDVLLETDSKGQSNWDFSTSGSPVGKGGVATPTDIEIDNLRIENARLTFREGKTGSTRRFNLTRLDLARKAANDDLALDLKADYNGQPVTLDGTIGSIHQLFKRERFPVQLAANYSGVAVTIKGAIDDIHDLAGFDLNLEGSGKDLSVIGPIIGQTLPPTDQFALKGRLRGAAKALSLEGAQGNARRGSLRLSLTGAVKDLLTLKGMDLQSSLTGQKLTEFGDMIGVKLPETDQFEIQGRLTGSTDGLALQAAKASAGRGSLRLSLTGAVKDLLTLKGMDLQSSLTGQKLTEFGDMIGVKLPETDQFEIQGQLTGSTDGLALQAAKASAGKGSMRLSLAGTVKDLLTLKGMDLQSSLTGKQLAEFGDMIGVKLPETDEFEIQGRLTGSTDVLALQAAKASAGRGSLRLSLTGTVKDLLTLKGMDLKSQLTGKELAELGSLAGSDWPKLGPFDVSGKLSGSAQVLSLSKLSAIIDKSDFKGQARLAIDPKPEITLKLASSLVDFSALMESMEKDQPTPDEEDQGPRRLFSDTPLPFDALPKLNADIVMTAENIQAKAARFKLAHIALKLVDGNLSIDKFEGTYRDTKITGGLHVNHGVPTRVATHFVVQDFDLGSLLKETGVSDKVRATIDIAAELKSRGDSVASLMAALDGSIGAVMGKGYLTRYLDMLSANLSQKVLSFWTLTQKHRKQADQINCAVVQFDIQNGVAASRAFVFDSALSTLTGEGEINLGTEKIDFLLRTKAKDPTLLSLSTNLRVSGAIMDPSVGLDKRSLLTQGGWALSSLAIGPVGLLAPFVHLGAHKAHPCDIKSIGQAGKP